MRREACNSWVQKIRSHAVTTDDSAVNSLVADCLACFRSADPAAGLSTLFARLDSDQHWSPSEKQELHEIIRAMHRDFLLTRAEISCAVLVTAHWDVPFPGI
jgi:hypothetical protein